MQHILPQHLLSHILGKIANNRWPPLKSYLIRRFIQQYRVDLSFAEQPNPEAYPSFNAFFTRALRAGARPIAPLQHAIVSPVDGCISQVGVIQKGQLLQAKGHHYTVDALLAHHPQYISHFQEGAFATLYIAPKDYHRVHMPLAGTLLEMQHVPGRLFSVNATTAKHVPNLFARNERVNCFFETVLGPVAIVLVGALIVGSIETVWAGTVRSVPIFKKGNTLSIPPFKKGNTLPVPPFEKGGLGGIFRPSQKIHLAKGAEMGRFKLGSTVIVLFPPNKISWENQLCTDTLVQMGQLLGTMTT